MPYSANDDVGCIMWSSYSMFCCDYLKHWLGRYLNSYCIHFYQYSVSLLTISVSPYVVLVLQDLFSFTVFLFSAKAV